MNQIETSTVETPAAETPAAAPPAARGGLEPTKTLLVSTLCDLGAAWADAGIGIGRLALENSARALGRTARVLETLQDQLKRDDVRPAD